jgi:hypothetical protein
MSYTGSAYIGVVGPEDTPQDAMTSILAITRQEGDAVPTFVFATKGYEARQIHFDKFMASNHEFLLLLDHDMVFAADTLERLRAHGLPFVTGLYMRRNMESMRPVWFEPYSGWPYMPWCDDPERGRLHLVGASGWGCVLLHREVVTAVRAILKGERDVIEDDMDTWPTNPGELPRVLRGDKNMIIGSDIRYSFYALQAGYQLYGDPDVRPGHYVRHLLTPDHYKWIPADVRMRAANELRTKIEQERAAWRQRVAGL